MQGLVADTDNPPGNALVLSVFRGKDDLIDATGVNDFCAYPLVAADFGLSGNDNFDFHAKFLQCFFSRLQNRPV